MEMREFGEEADEYRGEIFKKKYLPQVRPFPKVRELFERVRSDGKKIALASSGKEDEVEPLRKAGRDRRIWSIRDDDCRSGRRIRNRSRMFSSRRCGRSAHLPPEEAIAIGDTPYDVEAAKKIDLPIIGLLCGGFSEDALRDEGACAIFRDPADLLERYYQSPLAG